MPTFSLKTYADIAFSLLIVAFLAWVFHEGEKRIENADAKVAAAQVIHVAEVNQQAQSAIQAAEEKYRALYTSPPVAPVHVSVCNSPRASAMSSTAVVGPSPRSAGSDDFSVVPPAVGQPRDIGPDTDQLFDQADAQIEVLQAIVLAQQEQMEIAHGK